MLPITRVVLFKHGIGYFEREGIVENDAALTLSFKQAEVSDVLKSLTVLDLDGGHVAAVSYDSTKPIEQLLAEIAFSIPDSNSVAALVPQLKGARVAVLISGDRLEGVLLGVDVVEEKHASGFTKSARGSLLTEAGEMRSFALLDSNLQILDEGLKRDLDFYLRTQLSAKKKDARQFTLFAQGQGKRRVRLSYVLEAPVWKATYRILLNESDQQPLIQGWAVVDNMQDEDWEDVALSLVAGLPVSFVHDLYTPRYIRRPIIAVRETTGVLPPEVESCDSMLQTFEADSDSSACEMTAELPSMRRSFAAPAAALSKSISLPSSVPTQVRERQIGDLFEYTIERPVTIRRNQSALAPIVLKPFHGRSVLLYQKAARAENPMRCVEFENTTGLTLEGGPVTVLDNGSYVGEAMLETMKPKEQRLVPYAVELSVRVMDSVDTHRETVRRVVIHAGNLVTHSAAVDVTTYSFINKSEREYTVYLDHPRGMNDFTLFDSPTPHETTDNYWRFRFTLPANQTTKFVVRKQCPLSNGFALGDLTSEQLGLWIEQKYLDARTTQALLDVAALRKQDLQLNYRGNDLAKEREQIHAEQKRIRDNLQALGDRSSEKELRERFVKILNTQEDRLEAIDTENKKILTEREQLRAKKSDILSRLEYEGIVGG